MLEQNVELWIFPIAGCARGLHDIMPFGLFRLRPMSMLSVPSPLPARLSYGIRLPSYRRYYLDRDDLSQKSGISHSHSLIFRNGIFPFVEKKLYTKSLIPLLLREYYIFLCALEYIMSLFFLDLSVF